MKRFLNLKNNWVIIFIAAATLIGCSKLSDKKNYAAKVNDSYLTEDEVKSQTDSTSKLYRNEVINRWVEEEVLYQEALNNKVDESPEYKNLLNTSQRRLAIEIYLQKKSKELNKTISSTELIDYYNSNKNDFVLNTSAYLLNKANFSSENEAINFRTLVLNLGWYEALTRTRPEVENSKIVYADEISSPLVVNLLRELYPNEVSIIFKDENSRFSVIQLLYKFDEGTIMPFENIKEDVENRYQAIKMKQSIQQYIEKLYPKYEIEIREKK